MSIGNKGGGGRFGAPHLIPLTIRLPEGACITIMLDPLMTRDACGKLMGISSSRVQSLEGGALEHLVEKIEVALLARSGEMLAKR